MATWPGRRLSGSQAERNQEKQPHVARGGEFVKDVKLIGATWHYATEALDQGPIIDQEVVRVEHFHDVDDLQRLERDCEKLALARGVRFHAEDRVLVYGSRAIVFRD